MGSTLVSKMNVQKKSLHLYQGVNPNYLLLQGVWVNLLPVGWNQIDQDDMQVTLLQTANCVHHPLAITSTDA